MQIILPSSATILLLAMAACAAPPPASVSGAAPTPGAAPVARTRTGANTRPATTCTINGFAWLQSSTTIAPTMTVSNDGFCRGGAIQDSSAGNTMTLASPPQHGHVTTGDSGSMRATYQYYPEPGYEGPDSFTLLTGRAGRISAVMAVTVIR